MLSAQLLTDAVCKQILSSLGGKALASVVRVQQVACGLLVGEQEGHALLASMPLVQHCSNRLEAVLLRWLCRILDLEPYWIPS